jgi:predicted transcriptional regulator
MPQSIMELTKDLILVQIEKRQFSPKTLQETLQRTYARLTTQRAKAAGVEARTISPVPATATLSAPGGGWRKSISKHSVACLECGASYRQLSRRHLQEHDLDPMAYRAKHGIPRTQPLSAKAVTAMRRTIAHKARPWEKAPTYTKVREGQAGDGGADG